MQSTLNSWNARPGGSQGLDGPDLGRSIHQLMGRPRDGRCTRQPAKTPDGKAILAWPITFSPFPRWRRTLVSETEGLLSAVPETG